MNIKTILLLICSLLLVLPLAACKEEATAEQTPEQAALALLGAGAFALGSKKAA